MQVLVEALILGGLGSTLGVGLGILLSRGLSQLMGGLLNMDLVAMQIPPQAVVLAFVLGLVVTLLGAFVPARQAGSVSPVEAMRIRGQTKEGWLVRHGWKGGILLLIASIAILLWNPFAYDPQFMLGSLTVFLLFLSITLILPAALTPFERGLRPLLKAIYGVCGTLGSRNLERARVRSSITVGALLVGVAMILVVRGMTESFVADLRVWLQAYLGGDIYINAAVPLRRTLGTQLEGVPGVAAAAPIRYFPVEWEAEPNSLQTITFMAIDPAAHSRVTSFVFSEGDTDPAQALRELAQGDHVFLASVLAEKYGLQRGDQISLRTRSGMRVFTIAAVVVDFYDNGQMVTGSWTDMRRYFRINDANTFLVRVEEGYEEAEVESRIDQQLGKRYQLVLELNQSLRQRAFALLDQAFFMFDVLAVIAITVASLGVVNTLTMSVFERTREIGMLRATGLTRGQVLRMILAEAAMIGLVGGVLGLLLGVTLTRIFLLGMTAMSGYSLTFIMPLAGMLISLLIALVVSQAAALLPAMRAARTRILEAIQFE
jgi:putative ABC transport system permease protein